MVWKTNVSQNKIKNQQSTCCYVFFFSEPKKIAPTRRLVVPTCGSRDECERSPDDGSWWPVWLKWRCYFTLFQDISKHLSSDFVERLCHIDVWKLMKIYLWWFDCWGCGKMIPVWLWVWTWRHSELIIWYGEISRGTSKFFGSKIITLIQKTGQVRPASP